MLQIYNNFSTPFDDLFFHLERQTLYPRHSPFHVFPRPTTPRYGVYRFCSVQPTTSTRTSVQVKQVENDNYHQIFIYNPRGYKGFDVELVKNGREFLLVIESDFDSFKRVFRINKSFVDLNNIELQVNENDGLLITLPYNRESEKDKINSASKIAKQKIERKKEQIRQKKQELEQLERELAEEEQQSSQQEEKEQKEEPNDKEETEQEPQEKSDEELTSETEEIGSNNETSSESEQTNQEPQIDDNNLSRSSSHSPTLEDVEDEEFVNVSKSN